MSEETNDKKNPSLLGILKDAILRSKEKFKDISNREEIIQTLEALKEKVPTSKKDIKTNLYWFKETAKTLFKIPFIKPAVEVIRSELPRIDQQLTVKQKLQVAAIAPVIGAGAFIGTVGLCWSGWSRHCIWRTCHHCHSNSIVSH